MNQKTEFNSKRIYSEVGKYLRARRDESNLTQQEVSSALGYTSPQFVSNFERGISAPPLKKLKILLKLYGMPAGPLVEKILEAERANMASVLKKEAKRRR